MEKIIFFTNNITKTGGSEIQLEKLINKLVQEELRISIYDFSNKYPSWVKTNNIEIVSKNKNLSEYKFIIPWGGTNIKTFLSKFFFTQMILFVIQIY